MVKMDRKQLSGKLSLIKPALASKDIIPVFTHFMFTGAYVQAYDNIIGMRTLCDTEFKGAVPNILLDLLSSSSATDIKFTEKDAKLHIKMGNSRLTLPIIPPDKFLFEFPDEVTPINQFFLTDDFVRGLELCLTSTEEDGPPQVNGVTIQLTKDCLRMLSTDGETISNYTLEDRGGKDNMFVLPAQFVKTVLALVKSIKDDGATLTVAEGFAIASFDKGSVEIYTKLKLIEDALDFDGVVEQALDGFDDSDLVAIPSTLNNALSRSMVVMKSQKEAETKITVNDGYVMLHTWSSLGDVKDRAKLKGPHPQIEINANPNLLARVMDQCDKIFINERMVILTGDRYKYYCANLN